MQTLFASTLDQALANISDVPRVEVDETGSPKITFSGNYESPVNDLVTFVLALSRGILRDYDGPSWSADVVIEAVESGLQYDDNHYGGHATVTLNGVTLDGTSKYDGETEEDDEDF